jgi:hypothetical protein
MWRAILRWNAASRQRRTGWLILTVSVVYIIYFLKARLFAGGTPIVTKEWVYFALSFIGIMIGTINIRMADMRERNQQTMPLIDPDKIKK